MDKKFAIFQVFLVLFGIVLFFALAELKKRMSEERDAPVGEVVEPIGECNYHYMLGKSLNPDLIQKAGVYAFLVPVGPGFPDPAPEFSKVTDFDTIVLFVDPQMKVIKIQCLFK